MSPSFTETLNTYIDQPLDNPALHIADTVSSCGQAFLMTYVLSVTRFKDWPMMSYHRGWLVVMPKL